MNFATNAKDYFSDRFRISATFMKWEQPNTNESCISMIMITAAQHLFKGEKDRPGKGETETERASVRV